MIQVTGHRGAAGLAPENTLRAFRLARELGCDAVELDVQLTRDGELAVIHDALVDRTTDGSGPVAGFTMAELKRLDAGEGERIPTFAEVIALLADSPVHIQIELKGPDTARPTAELIEKGGLVHRVTLTSFFHRRVVRAKEILPEARTGILISCSPYDPCALLETSRADNLHVAHPRLDSELVRLVHECGKKIFAWGDITRPEVVDRCVSLGVDAIGSDLPDMVLSKLGRGGPR